MHERFFEVLKAHLALADIPPTEVLPVGRNETSESIRLVLRRVHSTRMACEIATFGGDLELLVELLPGYHSLLRLRAAVGAALRDLGVDRDDSHWPDARRALAHTIHASSSPSTSERWRLEMLEKGWLLQWLFLTVGESHANLERKSWRDDLDHQWYDEWVKLTPAIDTALDAAILASLPRS